MIICEAPIALAHVRDVPRRVTSYRLVSLRTKSKLPLEQVAEINMYYTCTCHSIANCGTRLDSDTSTHRR